MTAVRSVSTTTAIGSVPLRHSRSTLTCHLTNNRDDHLRNHGFVPGKTGWRLAPAFDVNPNIDGGEHVLNLDDADNRPNLETVLGTAAFYGLADTKARQIVEEVLAAVDGWRDAARRTSISGADIELTTGAFSAHAEFLAP